jgi:hypothetical protein
MFQLVVLVATTMDVKESLMLPIVAMDLRIFGSTQQKSARQGEELLVSQSHVACLARAHAP